MTIAHNQMLELKAAAKVQKATTGAKAAAAHNQLGRISQIGRGKTKTGPNTRTASQNAASHAST
jgi:hypothetical protein